LPALPMGMQAPDALGIVSIIVITQIR
jgi:hypothetical protein